MKLQIKILTLAVILLSGCTLGEVLEDRARVVLPSDKSKQLGANEPPLGEATAWVPLGLSKESYLLAERRLTKLVQIGMTRKEFLEAMKLNPALGPEWAGRVTAGAGWFSELSRKNKFGKLNVEEFAFGYYKKNLLHEEFAVIIENGKVARIFRSAGTRHAGYPNLPSRLFSRSITLKEETRIIESFYRKKLQTQMVFEKLIPQLKRIRAGWTSAELRIALGGGIYRMPNGLVYLQRGLLWDDGFLENGDGTNSVVILPFGYRDKSGKVHKKVIIRAEGGLVTGVFWQSDALQDAKFEKK